MAQTKIDGSKAIIFNAAQYEGIKKYLGELYSKTRAKAVLYADMAGQIIGERGDTGEMNTTVLSALAAGDFAATAEIAKLVGEGDRFKLHFHEGENKNVYLTNVGNQFFLIFKFFLLEILKFNKKEDKVEGMFDKCLFVLRNLSSLLERLCALRSRVFDRFFEAAEIAKFTSREFGEHWENLKSFRDWYSVMSTQLKKGREEDLKEGLETGL